MTTPTMVFFDMGNVLLHFDHRRAAAALARLAGRTTDEVFDYLFSSDLQFRYERGALTNDEFCDALRSGLGRDLPTKDLLAAASDMFGVNTPVLPLIGCLASAGWRLGVLSNTCAAHWELIEREFPWIPRLLPVHALSFRLQALKPEPEAFARAAELAGVSAGDAFFTDDREENVAAAREAGWDAVRFESAPELARQLRRRGIDSNYSG